MRLETVEPYSIRADPVMLVRAAFVGAASVGYDTAMVGKWHLGHADKKYWPQHRGFDHFYGNLVGEVDYFTKERGGIIDWQRDGTFLKKDGYFTTLIGDEEVKIIHDHNTSKPLFLYVASLHALSLLLALTPRMTQTGHSWRLIRLPSSVV